MRLHTVRFVGLAGLLVTSACASHPEPAGPAPAQLAVLDVHPLPQAGLLRYDVALPQAGYLTLLEMHGGYVRPLPPVDFADLPVPAGRHALRVRDQRLGGTVCDRCSNYTPAVGFGGGRDARPVSETVFEPGVQTPVQVFYIEETPLRTAPRLELPREFVLISTAQPLAAAELAALLQGAGQPESAAALMSFIESKVGSLAWASYPTR